MQPWLSQVEIGPLVRSLLDDEQPITIAVFTRISDEIADTSIVAATPAAARLFGYESPNDLVGRFVSTLHLLEDIKVTRLRSAMRNREVRPCEDTYTMRIVRQDGTIQPVIKHVRQVEHDGIEIWVTRHKKSSKDQGPPMPRKKINAEQLYAFWGSYSVAEANATLRLHNPVHNPDFGKKVNLTPEDSWSILGKNSAKDLENAQYVSVRETSNGPGAVRFSFGFQDVDTIAIDLNGVPGIYLHECQQVHCGKQFTSRRGNPQRCTHCGSRMHLKSSSSQNPIVPRDDRTS